MLSDAISEPKKKESRIAMSGIVNDQAKPEDSEDIVADVAMKRGGCEKKKKKKKKKKKNKASTTDESGSNLKH